MVQEEQKEKEEEGYQKVTHPTPTASYPAIGLLLNLNATHTKTTWVKIHADPFG